jgi:hypothetical protein
MPSPVAYDEHVDYANDEERGHKGLTSRRGVRGIQVLKGMKDNKRALAAYEKAREAGKSIKEMNDAYEAALRNKGGRRKTRRSRGRRTTRKH